MKPFQSLPLLSGYRSGTNHLVNEFYKPCLNVSTEYKRAVGYFRSSIFSIIGEQVIEFCKLGGNIKVVCSPEIDIDDEKFIRLGNLEKRQYLNGCIERNIDELLESYANHKHAQLLGMLISINKLDIKFAIKSDGSGIYHEKIGVFSNRHGESVSFIGSANETISGWNFSGNFESIEVFRSWISQDENSRVMRHNQYFEDLWNDKCSGVLVLDFEESCRSKLIKIAHTSIEEYEKSGRVHEKQKEINVKSLFPHQIEAIANWEHAGFKGIIEHATGSGKTITAISAIKQHLILGFPVLVLVPSELLLKQWAIELSNEITDITLLLCGAGNDGWKTANKLKVMTTGVIANQARVTLSTMQTAASELFQNRCNGSNHLLLVADEVHQIGSSHLSKCLRINSNKRLGLSATPKRYGDPDGTARIFEYFGPVIQPVFTLNDAISSNRLVQYEYFPVTVILTEEEESEWKKLSEKIRLEYFKSQNHRHAGVPQNELLKNLLIKRSRIAKKALNKAKSAANIISKTYEDGDRVLVYCEDQDHLSEIRKELGVYGIDTLEYHSGILDTTRIATLDWFKRYGGVLLSIRCLDEGVDIPQINKAVILASSQNPRQFIQRRGRVLRFCKDKGFAQIWDLLVIPNSIDNESHQFGLLKSELMRSIEFASSAINKTCALELRSIADKFGIDSNEPDAEEEV